MIKSLGNDAFLTPLKNANKICFPERVALLSNFFKFLPSASLTAKTAIIDDNAEISAREKSENVLNESI